jgi:RNA polymerase sigma-70 factor (ECF subfamily)
MGAVSVNQNDAVGAAQAEKCAHCGDEAAVAPPERWAGVRQLVHQHRAHLAAVARSEGLTAEDAFDAVQEAFQKFLEWASAPAPATAAEPDDRRRLLVALTRNIARNRRRLHAVARPHVSDEAALEGLPATLPTVEEQLIEVQEQGRLSGCVSRLADIQRAVVTLRMLEERPGEDVARLLDVSPGHVAVLLHRAKARLLACMAERKESNGNPRSG